MYRTVAVGWHCVGWGLVDNTMVVGACKRQQGCDELVCVRGCLSVDSSYMVNTLVDMTCGGWGDMNDTCVGYV